MEPSVSFLLQIALILGTARLFGEVLRRLNQPPVLGELLAGILLGPSVLGWFWRPGFDALFGHREALDTLSTVGLVLLMLLTGLETDLRVMRNMGRAAFAASFFGMVIPFASGFLLGSYLGAEYVHRGRLPLELFLATAMAISAMPVIAKILIDLNMMKRNFGIVILSAAVVDDTIGWIILAAISGLVSQSFDPDHILITLGWLLAFIVFARFALYPAMRWTLPKAEHALRMPAGEMVLVVVIAFLCAAATEAMHVHAVFGAFVAGALFRQCPTLGGENLHRLESVTLSLFAPLFFGAVGLRVDFTTVQGFWLPVLVIAIAVSGKIVGCFIGGLLGRMPRWEALALGLGMSARGAMELVVAKIGLDLGILNGELFSIIVLMAIVTSFLAPLTLRAIAHKLPLSEEEKLREKSGTGGFVSSGPLKVLIPAAGGRNALIGCHLAAHLCLAESDRCTALYVESGRLPWWRRILQRAPVQSNVDLEAYFRSIKTAAASFSARLGLRKTPVSGSVLETILAEAQKGYRFLIIGASGYRHPVYDPFVSEVVKRSPCHLVVVSAGRQTTEEIQPFRRILVPTNGSYYADAAFDLAARYAESTDAQISVLYVTEGRQRNPLLPAAALFEVSEHMQDTMKVTLREQFRERVKNPSRLDCLVRERESVISALVEEVQHGSYDLVVLGAENKSLVERLYLGQHIEAAITEVPCTIAVVIPKIGPSR